MNPTCPACQGEYAYQDGTQWICPECQHEWQPQTEQVEDQMVIRDANGNPLQDGDSVTVIKDLKIKGSSQVIKVGSKAKNIRLLAEATDGHDIDCKIDGIGAVKLKSAVVKKA